MSGTKKHPGGRPPLIDQGVIDKLEQAYSFDCTDEEACIYAGIRPSTLYKYQQRHPGFIERKMLLKQKPFLAIRQCLIKGAMADPDIALRYMERKKKSEFSLRTELTDGSGEPFKVVINVPRPDGE